MFASKPVLPLLLNARDAFISAAKLLVVGQALDVSQGPHGGGHKPREAEHAASCGEDGDETHVQVHAEPVPSQKK